MVRLAGVGAGYSARVALALAITSVVFIGCPVQPSEGPAAPVALFDARPASGHPPLEVQFTDQSKAGATPIQTWQWDFGDGTSSADPNPRHEYYLAGTYAVSLTVASSTSTDTLTKANCVILADISMVGGIGPAGGTVTTPGATLTVPAGVFQNEIVIAITPKDGTVPLNYGENEQLVSDVCTISQDQPDDLYGDALKPMQLTIPFTPELVPANSTDNVHLQVVAQLDNGVAIPIMGVLNGSSVVVSISGLPRQAAYGVVARPQAVLRALDAGQAKEATGFLWPVSHWQWCYTPDTLEALTALDLGTIYAPDHFDRRDWSALQQQTAISDIESTITRNYHTNLAAGFMSPALVATASQQFTLVFYPMNNPAVTQYANVTDVTFAASIFGNIVIDPGQLDAISKLNAGLGPDQAQKLDFANAFSSEMFHAIFRGYDFPVFTQASPMDLAANLKPRSLPYFKGLEDGMATYIGQVGANVSMARALGANETALLSEPLFAPFASTEAAYSYASQDFLFYVGNRFTTANSATPRTGPLGFIADSFVGVLEQMRLGLTQAPAPASFDAALTASHRGFDLTIQRIFAITLPQVFWEYSKTRAYENDSTSDLRPSDLKRAAFSFNSDRFESGTIFQHTFTTTNEVYEIAGADGNALAAVPPLATRAVILDVSGTFGNLDIESNASEWVPDTAGNSVMIKAYKSGQNGQELGGGEVVLSDFGNPTPDGFTEAVIVISNVTLDKTYPVTITASLETLTGGVRGQVMDAGASDAPLAGVNVTITQNANSATLGSATTDSNGDFTVTNLQPGPATVTFKKAGYNTKTSSVTIAANQTATLSVEMIPLTLK